MNQLFLYTEGRGKLDTNKGLLLRGGHWDREKYYHADFKPIRVFHTWQSEGRLSSRRF